MPDMRRYQSLLEQWALFQEGREVDGSIVRPEILASWRRCAAAGLSSENRRPPEISVSPEILVDQNRDLLDTAIPIMNRFIESIKKGRCVLTLYNAGGICLYNAGHPEDIEKASHLVPGSRHTEDCGGTSIISLVLDQKRPIEIYGPEHWIRTVHGRHGSGAPLVINGEFRGLLCCSQDISDYSPLTLAMVEMASHMIEEQFVLKSSIREKEIILQLVDEGILYIDAGGRIIYGNDTAREILHFPSLHGRKIPPYLLETVSSGGVLADVNLFECRYRLNEKFVSCIVSSTKTDKGHAILTIRPQERMSSYVAQQAGYTARYTFDSIIGSSEKMREAVRLAQTAAAGSISTLLYGESGTGKELFAQAIHNASARSGRPFVALNCGAIPKSLIQSELFGYEEGSFTGASRKGHPGKFELADGGTLFLDEISELPMEAQSSLLRVIQTRQVERIGGAHLRPVDVRIIAATNRDLYALVGEGGFRHDLLYRINALTIGIPALRERRGDLPRLIRYFLEKLAGGSRPLVLSERILELLYAWHWPGNVRELENVMECFHALDGTQSLSFEAARRIVCRDSGPADRGGAGMRSAELAPGIEPLSHMEREAIEKALAFFEGNVRKTAEALGVSRKALYDKIGRYRVDVGQFRT